MKCFLPPWSYGWVQDKNTTPNPCPLPIHSTTTPRQHQKKQKFLHQSFDLQDYLHHHLPPDLALLAPVLISIAIKIDLVDLLKDCATHRVESVEGTQDSEYVAIGETVLLNVFLDEREFEMSGFDNLFQSLGLDYSDRVGGTCFHVFSVTRRCGRHVGCC